MYMSCGLQMACAVRGRAGGRWRTRQLRGMWNGQQPHCAHGVPGGDWELSGHSEHLRIIINLDDAHCLPVVLCCSSVALLLLLSPAVAMRKLVICSPVMAGTRPKPSNKFLIKKKSVGSLKFRDMLNFFLATIRKIKICLSTESFQNPLTLATVSQSQK